MKKYTINYRTCMGQYRAYTFEGTCDTDAKLAARDFVRATLGKGASCYSLFDFWGNYIEL